jgi:competence protein ComEA
MKHVTHVLALILVAGLLLALPAGVSAATTTKAPSSGAAKAVININTADAAALDNLPRVGPKLATRIVEYRKANGSFKRIQDLMKVKGIGPKVFEKLKDQIAV